MCEFYFQKGKIKYIQPEHLHLSGVRDSYLPRNVLYFHFKLPPFHKSFVCFVNLLPFFCSKPLLAAPDRRLSFKEHQYFQKRIR